MACSGNPGVSTMAWPAWAIRLLGGKDSLHLHLGRALTLGVHHLGTESYVLLELRCVPPSLLHSSQQSILHAHKQYRLSFSIRPGCADELVMLIFRQGGAACIMHVILHAYNFSVHILVVDESRQHFNQIDGSVQHQESSVNGMLPMQNSCASLLWRLAVMY